MATLISPSGRRYQTDVPAEINDLVYGQGYKIERNSAAPAAPVTVSEAAPAAPSEPVANTTTSGARLRPKSKPDDE